LCWRCNASLLRLRRSENDRSGAHKKQCHWGGVSVAKGASSAYGTAGEPTVSGDGIAHPLDDTHVIQPVGRSAVAIVQSPSSIVPSGNRGRRLIRHTGRDQPCEDHPAEGGASSTIVVTADNDGEELEDPDVKVEIAIDSDNDN